MSIVTGTFRRRALQRLALVALTLLTAACGALDVCTNGSEVALGKKAPPSQNPGFVIPPPPSATATAAATATPAATAPAVGGTLGLGYDHPPFMQPWGVGGNSVAFVCGSMTGGPTAIQVEIGRAHV